MTCFVSVVMAAAALVASAVAANAPLLDLDVVLTGLTGPIAVTNAGDGSGRLFVAGNDGVIRVVDSGVLLPTPFVDLSSEVICACGELGFLGFTFHPDYEVNGQLYVSYIDAQRNSVLARMTVSGNPDVVDPSSHFVVLSFFQPGNDHNGGDLHFGPDGYLYMAFGDGGSDVDPTLPQDGSTLIGKMIRIDVDSATPYAIPPDNPFVGSPGVLDEIWASGLRNPWRFSFDRVSGDLFIGDVGRFCREEISHEAASSSGGLNFGWREMEGSLCYREGNCASVVVCDTTGLTTPILEYDHSEGNCSVTGGFVYRGSSMPSLVGSYLYADYCSGRVWAASSPGSEWGSTEVLDSDLQISAFGEDEQGELYVLQISDDRLFKLRLSDEVFSDGFEAGSSSAWSAQAARTNQNPK